MRRVHIISLFLKINHFKISSDQFKIISDQRDHFKVRSDHFKMIYVHWTIPIKIDSP